VLGEVVPEVAMKCHKTDPVIKIRAIKDNKDELAEWVSTHEELYDRGHPQYYVRTHKDALRAGNAPSMYGTLLSHFPNRPFFPTLHGMHIIETPRLHLGDT